MELSLKTLSVRSLRMFALTSAAAVMLSGALPASAAAMAPVVTGPVSLGRPGCKQVCYQDPGLGKVCQWVCEV